MRDVSASVRDVSASVRDVSASVRDVSPPDDCRSACYDERDELAGRTYSPRAPAVHRVHGCVMSC